MGRDAKHVTTPICKVWQIQLPLFTGSILNRISAKLGDFGLSFYQDHYGDARSRNLEPDVEQDLKKRGTEGYLTPVRFISLQAWLVNGLPYVLMNLKEQFTDKWAVQEDDEEAWRATGIAGNYTSAMNIWGLGCVMYGLMHIQDLVLETAKPFVTSRSIQGVRAKGMTYGKNLINAPYSDTLKEAVWACLYGKLI